MTEKEEKKYLGTLYGMRMENKTDLNIKKILLDISEEKDIPVNRLIFAYLGQALHINEGKEIIDKEELNGFEFFLNKISERVISFENKLQMKNFEKKESLRNYIYNKYPDKIQKKKFFLEILQTQIFCERELLFIFLNLYDYKTKKDVGYFKYVAQKENLSFTDENYEKISLEYQLKLYSQWFLELRIAGVIGDLSNFNKIEKIKDFDKVINYKALEKFIFELYEGHKLLYSPKEERIKMMQEINQLKEKKAKYSGLKSHFKKLFRELVKYYNRLSNEILNLEESEYIIFRKIGYKPHIFYDILNLDDYITYIGDNNLEQSLSYAFSNNLLLYKQFNEFYNFPPQMLITRISLFFSYLNRINEFLEKFPNLEKQKAYSVDDIHKIGLYLGLIDKSDKRSLCNKMLNEIPIEKIHELTELIPKNYYKIFGFIKDYLKEYGIDLELELETVQEYANQRIFELEKKIFNLYPEEIKTEIINSYKEFSKYKKER